MATTRLLFAGCGAIAGHHLRALQASGRRWEVSAVADPNNSAAEAFVRELPQPEKCKVGGAEWGERETQRERFFDPSRFSKVCPRLSHGASLMQLC